MNGVKITQNSFGLLKRKDIEKKKGRRNRELRGGLYFWRDEIFELGSGCGCGMGRTGVELSRIQPHDVHGVLLAGSQGQVERVDSGQCREKRSLHSTPSLNLFVNG